jgi:hypothetical protein
MGGGQLIIVLAPRDADIVRNSRAQSFNFPEIYGETYIAGEGAVPQLGVGEDVFFVGHGVVVGDSGNAEIGDEDGDFAVNGIELWQQFEDIFPDMYQGRVYIDACHSADFPDDAFSVIETFKSQSAIGLGDTQVFGRTGDPVGDIPRPDAVNTWFEA